MNYLQTELILLNLLRQSEEFVVSLLGLMPEPDAGSFYKRLSTLYETFKADKTGFAASLFRLGQVALFLKEYAALTKQNIDQVDIPEILSPAISWEDIEDKPEFFAPYTHFHKWEEIANKPVKYLPVTHQHTWNDVSDKPTTFPPSAHTHDAQAVAWNDVTDKPTTFPPAEHTHEAQPVAVTWADVSDKPTTFPPAEHTHAAAAVAWADVTDKPTTFPPAAHTHPEYEGGGAANGGQWTLRLNGNPLNYTQLPPTLWTGQRLIVKIIGTLLMAEDAWMLRIDEEGGLLAGILASTSGNITAYTGLGGAVGVSMLGTAITAVLDITPTHMTLTVNGISASIETYRTYTESLLTIQIQQLLDIASVGIWTGDPATTAPLILADAEHIDNNVLINQAARHIGTGEYDLTLNAPVVIYR